MRKPLIYKMGMAAAVAALLALVFALYIDRALMVRLAEQLWACF